MTVLEQFEESTAWDPRYNLPLVPKCNNPWLYGAYAYKLIKDSLGETLQWLPHFKACEVYPGLFNRWPDGGGGYTSHDEIIGAAYNDPDAAERIFYYLEANLGVFNNTGESNPNPLKFYPYRFLPVRSFLKARSGRNIDLIDKALYSLALLLDLTDKTASGGHLQFWLMNEYMQNSSFIRPFVSLWRFVQKHRGITLKACLTNELATYDVFANNSTQF